MGFLDIFSQPASFYPDERRIATNSRSSRKKKRRGRWTDFRPRYASFFLFRNKPNPLFLIRGNLWKVYIEEEKKKLIFYFRYNSVGPKYFLNHIAMLMISGLRKKKPLTNPFLTQNATIYSTRANVTCQSQVIFSSVLKLVAFWFKNGFVSGFFFRKPPIINIAIWFKKYFGPTEL